VRAVVLPEHVLPEVLTAVAELVLLLQLGPWRW
jgi:hypothetical protein